MSQYEKVKISVTSAPAGLRSFLKRHPLAASAAVLAAGVLILAPFIPVGSPVSSDIQPGFAHLPATRSARNVVLRSLTPPAVAPAGQRISVAQALGRAMGLGAAPAASVPAPYRPGGSASADFSALKARGSRSFNQMSSSRFFGAGSGSGASAGMSTPMPGGAPDSMASRLIRSVQGFVGARGAASGAKAFVAGGSASAKSGSFSGAAETSYGWAHEGVGGGVLASGGPIGDVASAPAVGQAVAQANPATAQVMPANPAASGSSFGSAGQLAQNGVSAPGGVSPTALTQNGGIPGTIRPDGWSGAAVASAVTFSPSAAQWDMTAPLTVTVSGLSSAQNTRVCQAILAHPEIPTTPHDCIAQDGSINEGGFQGFAGGNADWKYTNGQWVGTFPTNYPTLGPGVEVQQVFLDASTGKFGVGTLKVTAPQSTFDPETAWALIEPRWGYADRLKPYLNGYDRMVTLDNDPARRQAYIWNMAFYILNGAPLNPRLNPIADKAYWLNVKRKHSCPAMYRLPREKDLAIAARMLGAPLGDDRQEGVLYAGEWRYGDPGNVPYNSDNDPPGFVPDWCAH